MKRLVFLVALPLCLVSCEKRLVLEGNGAMRSPSGNWKVELSSGPPGFKIEIRRPRQTPFGEWGTVYSGSAIPSDWTNHYGAFVYFDEDDRVWAFNGRDRSFIYQDRGPQGMIAHDFDSYKKAFPEEVLKRLPEPLATQYRNRGK